MSWPAPERHRLERHVRGGRGLPVDYTAGTIARTAGSGIPNLPALAERPTGRTARGSCGLRTAAGTAFAATKTDGRASDSPRVAAGPAARSSCRRLHFHRRRGRALPVRTTTTCRCPTILKAHPYYVQWPGYIRDTFGCATTVIMRAPERNHVHHAGGRLINAARVTQAYDLIILAFGMNGAGGARATSRTTSTGCRPTAPRTEFILMSGCTNYAGGGTIKSILDTVATSRSGVYVADGTARWATLVGPAIARAYATTQTTQRRSGTCCTPRRSWPRSQTPTR